MTDDDTARRLADALDAQAAVAGYRAPRPPLDSLGDAAVFTIEAETRQQTDPRRRRQIAMAGAAAAGVAAVAAVALVATNLGSGTSGHGSPAAAAQSSAAAPLGSKPHMVGHEQGVAMLKAAADARERTGDPTLRPDQWLQQMLFIGNDKYGTWRPANPDEYTNTLVGVNSSAGHFSDVCNIAPKAVPDPLPKCIGGRPGRVSPTFVANLPDDPAALYAMLKQGAERSTNSQSAAEVDKVTLLDVEGLLESNALPAARQAELLRVAAMIPSAEVYENERTLHGHDAIGVLVRSSGDVAQVNIDPSNGRYVGFGPDSDATVAVTKTFG